MPANWKEWLGVVGSITTIVAFLMYLHERRKCRDHDTLMVGFLHGIKPVMESTGHQQMVQQINDMLSRLQPLKRKS
jgi:hypothetical protein